MTPHDEPGLPRIGPCQLERVIGQGGMGVWANVMPFFDDVRDDPRFPALIARLKLPAAVRGQDSR